MFDEQIIILFHFQIMYSTHTNTKAIAKVDYQDLVYQTLPKARKVRQNESNSTPEYFPVKRIVTSRKVLLIKISISIIFRILPLKILLL